MISERISDDIPPKLKILNMVIPILMSFYSLVSNWSIASRIKPYKSVRFQMKCDVIDDIKLFPTVYPRIYCRKFLTISNQTLRYKNKGIIIMVFHALMLNMSRERMLKSEDDAQDFQHLLMDLANIKTLTDL